MTTSKPTTVYLDEEDRELAALRKKEYGQKSFTALVRLWLRMPPKKR